MSFSIEGDRFTEPWLPELIELLQLCRGARVMQIGHGSDALMTTVLEHLGAGGELLVLEPDMERAEQLAQTEHPGLHVLSYAPDGRENFGQHDALLAAPLALEPGVEVPWADIARQNLRPGGRFVIDLPAESTCDALFACWQEVGGADEDLDRLRGPSETDLAARLREAGLRQVESLVGTHLLRAESPRAFAAFAIATLKAAPDLLESLHLALAKRLKTNGPVEVIFRRTRVHGMR